MRTYRRFSFRDTPERREVLSSLGVRFDALGSPLVSPRLWFNVDESDRAWNQLRKLIPKWNVEDGIDPEDLGMVGTTFSKGDLEKASFLQIFAMHKGYPQPADDFGYLTATYDLSNYCQQCGMGKKQVAPFRMKGEPKWGKKHILQLNWVFDEFFVLPYIWETVFQPMGIGHSVVLDHRTEKPLKNVVQLTVKDAAPSPLAIADCPSEVCASCGRKKYLPISRGFFPSFETYPGNCHVFKTQEVFGSGASAWNATVVTSDVFKAIQSHKVAGVTFVPLQKRDSA